MKTALLHYWLLSMRGGEQVLQAIARQFPEAPIYTHACRRSAIAPDLLAHPIHESLIAHLPQGRRRCQAYLPLMPLALRRWDFSGFDLLVSSESGPVKGVRKPPHAGHARHRYAVGQDENAYGKGAQSRTQQYHAGAKAGIAQFFHKPYLLFDFAEACRGR